MNAPDKVILKQDEIVRFRLKDYLRGHFLNFVLHIWDLTSGGKRIFQNSVFTINQPYKHSHRFELLEFEPATPMDSNSLLLYVDEPYFRDKIYVIYVDEEYKFVVNSTDIFVMDLKPVIANFIGHFNLRDIY